MSPNVRASLFLWILLAASTPSSTIPVAPSITTKPTTTTTTEDINECAARPCRNGGSCENYSGGYECQCINRPDITYAGRHCEEVVRTLPQVIFMEPTYGPIAGGTEIVVSGQYFTKFPPLRLELNGTYMCDVIPDSRSATQFRVVTPAGDARDQDEELTIVAIFEGGLPIPTASKFKYLGNPVITGFHPTTTLLQGGTTITVEGESLTAIAAPILEVTVKITRRIVLDEHITIQNITSEVFSERCNPAGESLMCPTPGLTLPEDIHATMDECGDVTFNTDDSAADFYIGFKLDGLDDYRNLSASNNTELANSGMLGVVAGSNNRERELILVMDPIVHKNPDNVTYEPDAVYELEGEHMDSILETDYKVEVGLGVCQVVNVTCRALRCRLPPPTPKKRPESTGKYHVVTIHIGNNTVLRDMGYIYYEPQQLTLVYEASAGAAALVVIIVFTVAINVRRRKRKGREHLTAGRPSAAWTHSDSRRADTTKTSPAPRQHPYEVALG